MVGDDVAPVADALVVVGLYLVIIGLVEPRRSWTDRSPSR
jgi:hypothetical protein